ncbi:MAG: dihydrofolate reductase [Bacteroidia bacterium]|jgi:dihydrofolate reductase
MISIIVAEGLNHAIGKNNQLLWHLPADLQYFKKITLGKTLIMGRATFDSIGRPLPGRRTIVVTRNPDWHNEGVETASSIDHAIDLCPNDEEIIIAGGADIYQQCINRAQRIYRTLIEIEPEADRYFPSIPLTRFNKVSSESRPPDEKNPITMHFEVWECK